MTKKIIFIFIMSLVHIVQGQIICGKVVYEEESNIDMYYKTASLMFFNDTISYTQYLKIKDAKPYLEKTYTEEEISDTVLSNKKDTKFIYKTKTDTYFTDTTWDKTLTVKENNFIWNWKILEETKKIGTFNCKKASIKFRGRKYFAWFTLEIPVPFGPWKFKNLPGLILEVYDAENLWHMKTKTIEVNTKEKCKIPFDTKQIAKVLNIQEYLKEHQRLINKDIKEFTSQLPKGVKIESNSNYTKPKQEIFKQK